MRLPQFELYFDFRVNLASSAPDALPVFGRDLALAMEDFEPARPEFAKVGHEGLARLFLSITRDARHE